MTQIINLLSFIKELVFNRGKKDGKKDHKANLLQTVLIAVLAASLYGDYLLAGRVYEKTKQVVSLKNEVQELRLIAEEVVELQYANNALSQTLELLTDKNPVIDGRKIPFPKPSKPKDTKPTPALPPNKVQRPKPAKELKVE